MLDANEADGYVLLSRVVPDVQRLEQTLALAAKIAGYLQPALMALKKAVNRRWESSLSEAKAFSFCMNVASCMRALPAKTPTKVLSQ